MEVDFVYSRNRGSAFLNTLFSPRERDQALQSGLRSSPCGPLGRGRSEVQGGARLHQERVVPAVPTADAQARLARLHQGRPRFG